MSTNQSNIKLTVFLVVLLSFFVAVLYFIFINDDTRERFWNYLQEEATDGGIWGFLFLASMELLILVTNHHYALIELMIAYLYPVYVALPCMIFAHTINLILCFGIARFMVKDYFDEKKKTSRFLIGLEAALEQEECRFIFLAKFTFVPLLITNFFLPSLKIQMRNYIIYGILGVLPKAFLHCMLGSTSRGLLDHFIYGKTSPEGEHDQAIYMYFFLALFLVFIVYSVHLTKKINKEIEAYAQRKELLESLLTENGQEDYDEDCDGNGRKRMPTNATKRTKISKRSFSHRLHPLTKEQIPNRINQYETPVFV